MTLDELNRISPQEAEIAFSKCCGASRWSDQMVDTRPFSSFEDLVNKADKIWKSCDEKDGLEAFSHHPKIGDIKSLEKKFASTSQWSQGEQISVEIATKETLEKLQLMNEAYEKRFGFIFIVCATGKSAKEMLELLESRINNIREDEIGIAMEEQRKISHIRLKKLIS